MSPRKPGSLLLAGALAVLLAACGESLTEEELLTRAGAALERGDARAAIVDAKTALQQNADNPQARRLLGEALLREGDLTAAIAEFERSLEAREDPQVARLLARALLGAGQAARLVELEREGALAFAADDPVFLAHLSRAQVLDGDGFSAEHSWQRAAELAPDLPEVALAEAVLLARHKQDLEQAEKVLKALVEEHPDYADGWSLYGNLHQVRGDLAAAAEAFAEATRINPRRLEDRLSLAAVLVEQEDFERAAKELDALQRLVPDHPGLNYAQARVALSDGDSERALEELASVFKVSPNHLPSLYLAANANFREGNLATAESQLRAFLGGQPGNPSARQMLAAVLLRKGEPEQAAVIARKLLEESPMNPRTMSLLALALSAQGLHADSAGVYQQQVAQQPESAEARMALGSEWVRAGEVTRGLEELERAREMAPDNTEVRARLAQAYLAGGDAEAARRELSELESLAPDSALPSILLARAALEEGDQEGAAAHFRRALDIDPGSDDARQGLAGLALRDDDTDTAMQVFREGLEAEPEDLESLMGLAAVQAQRGDSAAMAETLERAVQAHPEALEPRLQLGRYHFREGRPGEAVGLLTAVRDRHGDDPRLHQLLVGAYLALEQPGPAVTAARRLQTLLPEDPVALRLAAQAERAGNDLPRAERLLREALALEPGDVTTHKLLIEALMLQNKLEETSAELARLPEGVVDDPRLSLARGRIELALGNAEAAEGLIRSAHQARPDSNSVIFLGNSLLQQGKGREAERLLAEWIERHPEDPLVLERLATLYVASGRDERALPLYESLRRLDPEGVVPLNNLAWTLRQSDPERALALVGKALERAPENPSVLDTQAMILLEMRDYPAALQASRKALEADPKNSQLLFHRARILAASGDREAAEAILEPLVSGPAFPAQAQARSLLQSLTSP